MAIVENQTSIILKTETVPLKKYVNHKKRSALTSIVSAVSSSTSFPPSRVPDFTKWEYNLFLNINTD